MQERLGVIRIAMRVSTLAALVVLVAAPASAQPAAANNPVTIRVAGGDGVNPSTPLFAAQKLGYFQEAGLKVTYVTISGGAAPMAAALKANAVDVGLGGTIQFMDYVVRGLTRGKLVAELQDNANNVLAAKGITNIRQLKGKVIGISSYNAGDHIYFKSVFQYYGMGPDDVSYVPIGIPASRLAALIAGKVDAITVGLNSVPASAKDMILLGADESPVPQVVHTIFATQAFLDTNKTALQKFVAAVNKGTAWVKAHPDEAVTPCLDSGSDATACRLAIDALMSSKNPYTWSKTSRVNVEAIKAMIGQLAAADLPQANSMAVTDFVDNSVAGDGPP